MKSILVVQTRLVILVCALALVGLGCADTATALDGDSSSETDSTSDFRICAPPQDVGPVGACQYEVG